MTEADGARSISQNIHRRFENVQEYVSHLGGSKSWVIEKILIANNGNAAVKCIRSIRRWAYDVLGDDKAISFVVMATPEDLGANAEYIRMGDVIVDVPGGSNNHNYANVTLIVELARLHGVDAVWAGWGHASENPILPDTLARSTPPIKFIGPAGPPMRALGDKIGSTIIAQTAKVPCIAWNGDNILAEYDRETGCLPQEQYDKANIGSAQEAADAAEKIGFPVMIKASEGGGGKGIRRVDTLENVQTAYRQVSGEVPGSPIFIMKLSSRSRHLEVQLLADEYGDAVALNGRDCSVQRRHQKIIEEGPPVASTPAVWTEMEKAAVSLAKAVGYTNAGTVEYLYSEPDEKFYFLELNPRLQVEHPVTEMITRVNLPASQLQVAMGIPLRNIPEIRELYGRNRFEDDPNDSSSVIDFETATRVPPHGHCIAVRITAENAEAGFKPTSGGIQELNFRSTQNVWGYFSMDSSGSIHEFADSQFGHLFSSGSDREEARKNMVLALKELSIRGDISTTVDYISKLIELPDFVGNRIDTGWLDGLIKGNVDGMGAVANDSQIVSKKANQLNNHTLVVIGATIMAFDSCSSDETQFLEALEKGQLPSQSLLEMVRNVELILDGVKYKLQCTRTGQHIFTVAVAGNTGKKVSTSVRMLSDGGYLTDIAGKSHVAYLTSKGDSGTGVKLNIGGTNIAFSPDYDPSSLRTDVAGKLVKKLIPDGAHAKRGESYCEIEVMKMFMPLKVEETGTLTWCVNEGAAISPGCLLAKLELDNPESVATVTVFEGDLDVKGWGSSGSSNERIRPHLLFRGAIERLNRGMAGYTLSEEDVEQALTDLHVAVTDPTLPMYEIDEQLSVLSGRIPAGLFEGISSLSSDFKELCANKTDGKEQLQFPSDKVAQLLDDHTKSFTNQSENAAFVALTTPLRDAVIPYTKSSAAGVPGSERALSCFLEILRNWIATERWFRDGCVFADAIDNLRKSYKSDVQSIWNICRAHGQLSSTVAIVTKIVEALGEGATGRKVSMLTGADSSLTALPILADIGAMGGDVYRTLALKARKLMMQESLPSIEARRNRVHGTALKILESVDSGSDCPIELEDLISENVPISDVLFPLLSSSTDGKEEVALTEIYARCLYRTHVLHDMQRHSNDRVLKFTCMNKPTESVLSTTTPMTSMTDLTRIMSSSGSLFTDSESEDGTTSQSSLRRFSDSNRVPPMTPRAGVFKIIDTLRDLEDPERFRSVLEYIPQYKKTATKCAAGPINLLYFVVLSDILSEEEESMDEMAKRCGQLLQPFHDSLKEADIRRVSFIFNHSKIETDDYPLPAVFTYRADSSFKEDSLFRSIEPSHAYNLDLARLAKNFHVKSIGVRQTNTAHVHLYKATPRPKSLEKDKKANKAPRMFVRAVAYFAAEFSTTSFERILVDALNAMDLCSFNSASDNHLFINLVGYSDQVVLDPVVVEQVVVDMLKRHGERISSLGVAEVETRVVCRLNSDSLPIALRLVASNPTGYVHVMNTYVEAADGTRRVFNLIGSTKASMASTGDGALEGQDVETPYPLTRPFDGKRKAALKATDTLYCYDLPALFEAAVEQQWMDAAKLGGIEGGIKFASRPLTVMYTSELVVQRKTGVTGTGPWSIADYFRDDLELIEVQRGAGHNDVGMVAWLMVLHTVEYPQGRQLVLISNDITHKAGSFGTREDVVFKMASELARKRRLPRLFVAANSGARIGLAESIKERFKVAFKDPSKPENGFDYLYITKEDYQTMAANKEIIAEPVSLNGEEVYKITDIVGREKDLGVENLKGSGLIAGETSVANQDIFTMTIVLGRTVGIGAYLVRLGQRTIQKNTSSPIILTGYQALNKLMGVDVYSTNDQLGGPGIMHLNGISHLAVPDHLAAVKGAIDWLSFVPSIRGGLLPITDIRGIDNMEREIEFVPSPGIPYDPRDLLAGTEDDDGHWHSGFFDRGSFTEALAGWAKSVIVGRARLGGIPMGVIITENRTAEAVKPADPADVTASEAVIQQAGCVWFPNSAYKTAQAINDFRTEDLPLIIFANWRGFSGGQRDMFDEVLKYGSMIVDAFVAYDQPVFVFIPPFAEIRGGAWVVLDASINSSVMEMYATTGSARGGVLEANGAASVKYRTKDLLSSMHRLDHELLSLSACLQGELSDEQKGEIKKKIFNRERALLPVYEQIAVQFCELHDTPGRMKAVGVIEREVEWKTARNFFHWRLRRKLAEFDLRKKIMDAALVGQGLKKFTPQEASATIKEWFLETPGMIEDMWDDDQAMLSWMGQENANLEKKVARLAKECVAQEVMQVMTAGGGKAKIGTKGIVEGIALACKSMTADERDNLKQLLRQSLDL